MNTLLKIRKTEREIEPLFELVEFDPNTGEELNVLQDFTKLGIMVDIMDDDCCTGLKTGRYDIVKDKFDQHIEKIRKSNFPKMADTVYVYDITTMPAEQVEKILTHSGILKTILTEKDYPHIQGNAFDDFEYV